MISVMLFLLKLSNFQEKKSNVPRSSVLGVFQSQIIRYFRICSELDGFPDRLHNIVLKFINLSFDKRVFKSRFVCNVYLLLTALNVSSLIGSCVYLILTALNVSSLILIH